MKNQQPDINNIYLYVKDPFKSKYQLLINEREEVEIKQLKNPKAFNDYSQKIDDVYENMEDYTPTKEKRVLIAFHDMIVDMVKNKKLRPIATELLLRGKKINISLVFISQSYFKVRKTIRLIATDYFIMKILNERKLQQVASNYSSDTDFKDFMKLYKDYTKEPYSFLVNDATLSLDNPLRFRKNLLYK